MIVLLWFAIWCLAALVTAFIVGPAIAWATQPNRKTQP